MMEAETAKILGEKFRAGDLSAKEITQAYLGRISKHDGKLNAFLQVFEKRSLKKAEELDRKRKGGRPLGKLAGIPIAIKDNILLKGEITTCGSKFLENYSSLYSATVCELLEKEDAILIGKTNLDEFAMGGSGTHSAYGPTKNPWDLSRTPGGSSSGSAACVAARLTPLSLGSDTGGSIRQPASFTGITGFKPSYGRVSRYGLVAFASSMDQIGPFSQDAEDAALVMEVLSGSCQKDATQIQSPPPNFLEKINEPIAGTKVGIPWDFMKELESSSRSHFEKTLEICKELGVEFIPIDLSVLKYGIALYYILATAEASANLARFDGVRYGKRSSRATTLDEIYDFSRQEGFGSEVKNRILLGTYILSSDHIDTYYVKAQKIRTLIIRKMREAFGQCDLIAMPVTPSVAFPLDQIGEDPLKEYLQDLYTVGVNIAGLPAISVPSGFNHEGLPMGLQIIGPQMHDSDVLRLAHHFQKATDFATKIPDGFGGEL